MKRFKTFYNLYNIQKRFVATILIIIILFVSLMFRLFYLQVINGKSLQKLAVSEWLRDLPLSSKRGEIYDANGVSLATTITSYDVYVRAKSVDNAEELSRVLADNLDLDYEKVLKKVNNKSVSESLIKMQVDEMTAKSLTNYSGVYLSQNVDRVYPYSNLLTQVLGYTTIDNIGQAGLELYYDKYLKGVDGKSLVQTNAQGIELDNSLEYYIPSIPGFDLYTTLDVQMQVILERNLNQALTEHSAKAVSGIILDAKTGGIKAMCCLPSFDLNNPPRDNIQNLQALTKNSTVVDVYEPGSTFKLVTLAAALNEGLTSPDEHFYCTGRCSVAGETIKCWKTTGHGSENLVEAFKNSCNCVFVQLAERLGVDKYYEYLDLLGIGQKTGVDISGESSGIVMNKDNVRVVDLARIGFGHAIAVTELQMVNLYAMVTTGEKLTPHVLDHVDCDGETIYSFETNKSNIELKDETIQLIRKMLFNNINSIEDPTFIEGYDVGGKTGTAQKYDTNGAIASGKYIASFIGVYPTNDPEYILLICVDEPSNGAYYGGVVAKPVGQKVFSEIFNIKAIQESFPNFSKRVADIEMPYLIGKTIGEASSILKQLGLNSMYDSEGEYVVDQLPPAGTRLYAGEIVYLVLE